METTPVPDPRRWKALALVCTAFFMTVLDIAIVNVALPSLGRDLNFSQQNLQWVITAYALTFGGFLLLGGRAADLLGRRRVFFVGVALFTLASLACGASNSEAFLILARGVQGLGAAVVTPAALSIVTTTFTEGAERNKALGIWGAVGGSGAAVGVLAGGVLTEFLSWRWIFFVNVPVGLAVLLLTSRFVRESRIDTARRRYDPFGAITVTAGLVLLVYAVSKAPDVGWATGRTIGLLALSAALVAAFLVIESLVDQPLMPLGIFRIRLLSAANIVGLLLGGAIFGSFFLLTLYVQEILHFSALKTGVTFIATAGTAVVAAGAAQALVTKVGPKYVLATGMALLAFGQLWYTHISVGGSYWIDLFPGYVASGVGIAFSFVPVSIAALAGVAEREAGLASGLINTSQQIGGALGTAIVSTVATTHVTTLLKAGDSQPAAFTGGYQWGFWVGAGIALAAVIATLSLVRGRKLPAERAEPATATSP